MSAPTPIHHEEKLPREAYTLEEFAAMFGISRSTCYALFRKGIVKPSRILGRTVITHVEKERFATTLREEAA